MIEEFLLHSRNEGFCGTLGYALLFGGFGEEGIIEFFEGLREP